jgi:hypothetical protein
MCEKCPEYAKYAQSFCYAEYVNRKYAKYVEYAKYAN